MPVAATVLGSAWYRQWHPHWRSPPPNFDQNNSNRSNSIQSTELKSISPGDRPLPIPWLLERKKGSEDWERKGKETGTIAGAKVGKWFAKLQGVRAEEFEPATPEHLQRRGLVNPTVIRLVALPLGKHSRGERRKDRFGRVFPGTPSNGVVALREGNSPDLMIVPEPVMALASGDDLKGEAVNR